MLEFESQSHWLDSQLGRYQVITTWIDDCLQTGKPSPYITNTKVNSAFHPSAVGLAGIKVRRIHLCRIILCDPTWQVMLCSSKMGFL